MRCAQCVWEWTGERWCIAWEGNGERLAQCVCECLGERWAQCVWECAGERWAQCV